MKAHRNRDCHRRRCAGSVAATLWLVFCASTFSHSAVAGDITLIIDDIGYSQPLGERAVMLPGPVAIAVLPDAPNTPVLAELAHAMGKELILHQPMQPRAVRGVPVEVHTLNVNMDDSQFVSVLRNNLSRIPNLIGLSNHTGSLLTQHSPSMNLLMTELARRDLLFVDSRTSAQTVAYDVARTHNVPALKRDVFLDHDPRPEAIRAAFEHAQRIARRTGSAVVIAHPYENSLNFLEAKLRALPGDLRLRSVTEMVKRRHPGMPVPGQLAANPHRGLGH